MEALPRDALREVLGFLWAGERRAVASRVCSAWADACRWPGLRGLDVFVAFGPRADELLVVSETSGVVLQRCAIPRTARASPRAQRLPPPSCAPRDVLAAQPVFGDVALGGRVECFAVRQDRAGIFSFGVNQRGKLTFKRLIPLARCMPASLAWSGASLVVGCLDGAVLAVDPVRGVVQARTATAGGLAVLQICRAPSSRGALLLACDALSQRRPTEPSTELRGGGPPEEGAPATAGSSAISEATERLFRLHNLGELQRVDLVLPGPAFVNSTATVVTSRGLNRPAGLCIVGERAICTSYCSASGARRALEFPLERLLLDEPAAARELPAGSTSSLVGQDGRDGPAMTPWHLRAGRPGAGLASHGRDEFLAVT